MSMDRGLNHLLKKPTATTIVSVVQTRSGKVTGQPNGDYMDDDSVESSSDSDEEVDKTSFITENATATPPPEPNTQGNPTQGLCSDQLPSLPPVPNPPLATAFKFFKDMSPEEQQARRDA